MKVTVAKNVIFYFYLVGSFAFWGVGFCTSPSRPMSVRTSSYEAFGYGNLNAKAFMALFIQRVNHMASGFSGTR